MTWWSNLRRLGHIAAVLVRHLLAHVVGAALRTLAMAGTASAT